MKTMIKTLTAGVAVVAAGALLMLGLSTMNNTKAHAQPSPGYYSINHLTGGNGTLPSSIATGVTTNIDTKIDCRGTQNTYIEFYGQNFASGNTTVTIVYSRNGSGLNGSTNEIMMYTNACALATTVQGTVDALFGPVTGATQGSGSSASSSGLAGDGATPFIYIYSINVSGQTLTNYGFWTYSQ